MFCCREIRSGITQLQLSTRQAGSKKYKLFQTVHENDLFKRGLTSTEDLNTGCLLFRSPLYFFVTVFSQFRFPWLHQCNIKYFSQSWQIRNDTSLYCSLPWQNQNFQSNSQNAVLYNVPLKNIILRQNFQIVHCTGFLAKHFCKMKVSERCTTPPNQCSLSKHFRQV